MSPSRSYNDCTGNLSALADDNAWDQERQERVMQGPEVKLGNLCELTGWLLETVQNNLSS